jgi:cation-transporting ATPase E
MTQATLPAPALTPSGLDDAAVAERVARGQNNVVVERHGRSYADILRSNLFTRFNFLLGALWVIAVVIGPVQDTAFGLIVVSNAVIGVVQEVRAKRTLDRLGVLSAPRATVRRSGQSRSVELGDIVIDDVIELRRGDQLAVDGTVLSSDSMEIDESLLSGEAEPVAKQAGDEVLSGSFVVAGGGLYRATRVGDAAYARQLTDRARVFTLVRSELRDGINTMLLAISVVIPPMAVVLIVTQMRANANTVDALRGSVAGLVAMVPEGLVLLTSLALAVAVVRLGQRKALVQELAAVEMLARVDVVCLDKTGTLTEGDIHVHSVDALQAQPPYAPALAALAAFDPAPNASLQAIALQFPSPDSWHVSGGVPFSSARRWSAVAVQDQGAFVLGAPDVVLGDAHDGTAAQVVQRVDAHSAEGRRTLVLAHAAQLGDGGTLPRPLVPIAVVALEETLRSDAPDTVGYFLSQGVAVKVISGDNPGTVAAVARRAGVPGADAPLDGRDLPDALADTMEAHGVVGRVAPQQKRAMIAALQRRGHTVAMTGDGVNDVLALKDADIGIAMGSGSGASRSVAQLVLLDGRFSTLPFAVAEGRRVIANVERVGNLFLTKTAFAVVLIIAAAVASLPYPLLARHLTLISTLTIGIPGFFLALAPTAQRARRGFVPRILRFALPAGALLGVAAFLTYWLALTKADVSLGEARTTTVVTLLLAELWLVVVIARPLNLWKAALIAVMAGAFAVVIAWPSLRTFFGIVLPEPTVWLITLGIVVALVPALWIAWRLTDRVHEALAMRAAPA